MIPMDKNRVATEREREAAKNMRWKKSIADGFNLQGIQDELYEIADSCGEIGWCADGDIDELIDALDGDEEEAYEFRMLFSELSAEADSLQYRLREEYIVECFNDFFAAVADGGTVKLLGYDTFETDYFYLVGYDERLARDEAAKRLMRLTKQDLIAAARQCFGVATAMLNIRGKYERLSASMDIIRGENHAYLETIKQIEQLYNDADAVGWDEFDNNAVENFDRAVSTLPEKVWIE